MSVARGRRSATPAIVLGAGTVAATAVAVAAARHAYPADVSPVVPSGGWETAWVGAMVGGFVLYAAGLAAAARSALRLRVALGLALLVQALPLAAPLLLSADVFTYWNTARVIIVHHGNPYTVTPSDYPRDPALRFASPQWRTEPAPYGPVWEVLGTAPAAQARTSPDRAQLGYRVLALLGVLAAVGLVAWSTRSAAAVAVLGWSPLIALHYAGGGHSDAWMAALLVLAVAARGRATGGAAWTLGAGFKAVPVVLLPLELARTRLRQPRAFWIGLAGTASALVVASVAAWGLSWVKGSLTGVHASAPLGGVHWLTETGLRHRYAVLLGGVAFLTVYAVLLRHAWRTGRARLSLAASALCFTSSLLHPWYALWPVALAAVEEDTLAIVAATALSGYLLLGDAPRL